MYVTVCFLKVHIQCREKQGVNLMHHLSADVLDPHFLKLTCHNEYCLVRFVFLVKAKQFHPENHKRQARQTGINIGTIYAGPRVNAFNNQEHLKVNKKLQTFTN